MKSYNIKYSIGLIAAALFTTTLKGQVHVSGAETTINGTQNNFDVNRTVQGKHLETIQSEQDDRVIKMQLVDDKMTELYINGKKIEPADWDKYSDEITLLREQIKRNREQAIRNQEQAKRNEEQAKRNQEQAVRNQEQAQRNELQMKKNEEQAQRNAEQAERNKEQEKRNAEQAIRNQQQAQRNELQAKRNKEQAEENEHFIKSLTEDLVNDKIIPDTNSLHSFTFNSDGMTINGVKQPEAVFKRYKEKYNWSSGRSMSYSRDGIINNN